MAEHGNSATFWSDFTGSGPSMTDYVNGDSANAQTSTDMNMDFAWTSSASFGGPNECAQMKSANNYLLEPAPCTGEANFVCIKTVCPTGMMMLSTKQCAQVMDSTKTKAEALTECQNINPAATLATPKTSFDQKLLEQFLTRNAITGDVVLAASKSEEGHWFWDDGSPIFIANPDVTQVPTSVMGSVTTGPASRIIDGIKHFNYFRTHHNNQKKWIEITLPAPILIPRVKVYSFYSAHSYTRWLDVRVGNDTTAASASATAQNVQCEYKDITPKDYSFMVFSCPSPGIVGNVITIQKAAGEELWGLEVEAYGKFLYNILEFRF